MQSHRVDANSTISVCMATFNGARYIRQQVDSIISQLPDNGELIICDDGSTDGTLDILADYQDVRIRVHRFDTTGGPVRNFERALALSSGDLVFLCDQDDVWLPHKVETIVDVFDRYPNTSMVLHALRLIDENGVVTADRWNLWPYENRGRQNRLRFTARQIVKGQVSGCATAFRRTVCEALLPFPNAVYAHDHWLAVSAPFAGEIFFISEPLQLYRRHGANVSPDTSLSLPKQIAARTKLVSLLVIAALRAARTSPRR